MLTDVQAPTDRYAPFLEEVRRDGEARAPKHGIARLVHLLFIELVMHVLMLMVRMAKRAKDGTLPEVAPVASEEASSPVSAPAVGVPRSSLVRLKPIAEAPCEMPVVAQSAGLTRPRHVDDDCWPPWRGVGIVRAAEAGFWGFCSRKWVLEKRDKRVHFVSI